MLYVPIQMNPNEIAYDGDNDDYDFTIVISGGACYGYQLYIDSVLYASPYTVTNVYDTGVVDLSSTPVYDTQTLTITVPSGTVSNSSSQYYQWYIDLYYDSGLTQYLPASTIRVFNSYDTPVLDFDGGTPISTITSSVYNFTADYSQAQGILPKYWKAYLYDGTSTNIFEETDTYYNGYINYQFTGLLDGENYYIQYEVTNQAGVYAISDLEPFSVSFTQSDVKNTLIAENQEQNGCIYLSWSPFVYITGSGTGSYSTLPGYADRDTFEPDASDLTFDVDVGYPFSLGMTWYQDVLMTTDEPILELSNSSTGDTLQITYNNSTSTFTLLVNSVAIDTITDAVGLNGVRVISVSLTSGGYEWAVNS